MTDRAEETRACKGGETRCVQSLISHMEECQVCGTAVARDLVDHPFFGFAAGCPKAEDDPE